MVLFPNAKINLGLEILGKRKDGYHEVESVMHPVDLFDVLEFTEARSNKGDTLQISGANIPGDESDNLCIKTLELLRRDFKLPTLRLFLHKAIPMGAGLGGGSSDAAHLLKGLNAYFELGMSTEDMEIRAAELGSDCPFFIRNTTALATGRGERLNPVKNPLADMHLLIAISDIHISTSRAYGHCTPKSAVHSPAEVFQTPLENWKGNLRNRFEEYAFSIHPQLADIKESLYASGAIYASMSGSGSAIYGIFDGTPPSIDFGHGVKAFEV